MSKADLTTHSDEIVSDPRLRRSTLRAHLDSPAGDRPLHGHLVFTTSGSTGEPAIFVATPDDFAPWVAALLRTLTLFGVVPYRWLWPAMWVGMHGRGVPVVNWLKFQAGFREARASPYLQTHSAFHFLLDYVPRWHWMTKPGGLIQFQPFVPQEVGERVFATLIERCQRAGLVAYLAVLKRHRPDPFLMTHAVDGYSLAMDFAVSRSQHRRLALWKLCQEMADVVLDAGGRFYYAKDAVLQASSFARIHGDDTVARFRELKCRLDPERLLESDLSRRLGV